MYKKKHYNGTKIWNNPQKPDNYCKRKTVNISLHKQIFGNDVSKKG